jgi:hypothetical protein
MSEPIKRKQISTPLALVSASVMVSIGVVAVISSRPGATDATPSEAAPVVPRDVPVDQSTPERAAESWLDAWRTRSHDVALRLSSGIAREKVELRRTREEQMSPEDRALGEAVWKQLADTRLRLRIDESENLPNGNLALRGRAEGEWMGRPYIRRMEFVMEKRGLEWFVAAYRFFEDEVDLAGPAATPGILPDGGEDPRMPGKLPERPPPPSFTDELTADAGPR